MIELFKKLIEEAKQSSTKESVACVTRDMIKVYGIPENLAEDVSALMKENNCTCTFIAEGTMAPKVTVTYHG